MTSPSQGLGIRQRKPETVDDTAGITVTPKVGVAPDHAAQVAAPVLHRVLGQVSGAAAEAHELVVQRQKRALIRSLLGTGDMLPAALGQESVIATSNELGAIFQRDP